MSDRSALLEAALDSLPDGMAVLSAEGEVEFWNQAAQAITGYAVNEVLSKPLPEGLDPLLPGSELKTNPGETAHHENRKSFVHARHKLEHELPMIVQSLVLRDAIGGAIGTALLFHPTGNLDVLPHGEGSGDRHMEEGRAEFEERLQTAFDDYQQGGQPFGVLWVSVDQAPCLGKTHGIAASRTMLDKVCRAIAHGLRPSEEIGPWSGNAFLILSHERSAEMLIAHAEMLTGLARTADFRWWGDRLSLTVSVGAAQAAEDGTEGLKQLLERAHKAMEQSQHEGGNRATLAAALWPPAPSGEDAKCSQS